MASSRRDHRRHPARARLLPRIPPARWSRPRSNPAAPTTAPPWCSTWSACQTAESADIGAAIAQLPLIPVPLGGETIDGFVLKVLVSDGRYSRLFGAEDEVEGGEVALKFPKPRCRQRGRLPRGLRPRGMGGRAREQPLGRPRHRAAAGAADLPLHGDAALSGRASGDAARAPPRARPGGRTQHRDQAGAGGGGAAPRRHHPSRHQAGQRHSRAREDR